MHSIGVYVTSFICLLAFILCLLIHLYFNKTKKIKVSAHLFLILYSIVIISSIVAQGLHTNAAHMWLMFIPVLSTLLLGVKIGLLYTLANTSIIIVFQIIDDSYGLSLPSLNTEQGWHSMMANIQSGPFIVYAAVGYATFIKNKAIKLLNLEKSKSEKLLYTILPKTIAKELIDQGKVNARYHKETIVLFADLQGFTSLCREVTPEEVVEILDEIYSNFDSISTEYNLYRLKTIGDCYMSVASIPDEINNPEESSFYAAQEMLTFLEHWNKTNTERKNISMRIGIAKGEAISGIVGTERFAYDVWGDTVNVASRLESNGENNSINIDENLLCYVPDELEVFKEQYITLKGIGKTKVYSLKIREF